MDCITMSEFNIDLIPLDVDILSLEMNNSFKEIFIDKSCLILN